MIYKINIESITVKNSTIIYMEVMYQYVVHLILFFYQLLGNKLYFYIEAILYYTYHSRILFL